MHEEIFALFTPTIQTSFKYQRKNLKKKVDETHDHYVWSCIQLPWWGLKSIHEHYCTSINHYPNYECIGVIPKDERVALIEDAKDKKMKKW